MQALKKKRILKKRIDISGIGLFLILALIVAVLSIITPYFLTVRNIFSILLSVAIIGVGGVGQTLVIVSGGLDLSVESVIACTSVFIGLLNKQGFPLIVSIFAGLLLGPFVGYINGVLIAKRKINAVITTLAMMSIVRGVGLLLTNAKTIAISRSDFGFIGRGYLFGSIPFAVIVLIFIYFLFYFVLNHTPFGRNVYAVGGNPIATRLAGIDVDKYRIMIYTIAGGLGSLSGILFASIVGAGLPYGASGYALDIIAAVILGGTSLAGGIGTVQGTLVGVLILGVLSNGLILLDISSFWQMVVRGIVLVIAVEFDQLKLTKRK